MLNVSTSVVIKDNIFGNAQGKAVLINTDGINKLKTVNTDNSAFFYRVDPEDRRRSPFYMELDETVANITTDIDDPYFTNVMDLDVYPSNNIGKTPVTHAIRFDSIKFGYDLANGTDCYIYVKGVGSTGNRLKKVLVNSTITDIETAAKANS